MLKEPTVEALKEALDDEYKAQATYRCVIDAFGAVRPFVNIVEAEGRHAAALIALFEKYGLPVPEDPWPGRVSAPGSVEEACRMGIEGEIENAEMYDRLLAAVEEPDVQAVLERLRTASQENHLPAFQRCLERQQADGRAAAAGGGRKRTRHRGGRGPQE